MKKLMYVIFDSKAGTYNTPIFFPTQAVAERSAIDALTDADSEIARHPEDYTMFCIGEYDLDTALLKPYNDFAHTLRFHELLVPTE